MELNKVLRFLGYVILSLMVLLLYGFTAYHAWILHSAGEAVVLLVSVGIIYQIYSEGMQCKDAGFRKFTIWEDAKVFFSILCGALVAYTLKVNVGLGAVLSASLVALISSLVFPTYGTAIYCGAFVGMTSSQLLVNHAELAFAASIAGILFLLADRAYNGFGGKLGTIAFGSVLAVGGYRALIHRFVTFKHGR